MASYPYEVYPSHTSADDRFVGQLDDVPKQHGIPVRYGGTNIRGAQRRHDEIGAAQDAERLEKQSHLLQSATFSRTPIAYIRSVFR